MEDIFGITLHEEGRHQIVRLERKLKIVFICAIAWSVINLLSIAMRYATLRQVMRYASGRNATQLVVVYSYLLLTIVLLPMQSYYYYAFSRQLKGSIETGDGGRFNSSFRLLNINATLGLLYLLVNLLYTFYTFFVLMKY